MKTLIEEVLGLQGQYDAAATPAMVRRGRIVSHDIPAWLERRMAELRTLVPGATDDLAVKGSDAAGAKATVPWTRIFSASRSPGASEGWYVVLLFSASGDAAYLSINQGTTAWAHGNFARRPTADIVARANWARDQIGATTTVRPDLATVIDLGVRHGHLAEGYELGNVVAVRYPKDGVPEPDALAEDVRFLVSALGAIYLAADATPQLPGDRAPDVSDALAAIEAIAKPGRKRGRPRLTQVERSAIERRAVEVALDALKAEGYEAKDVGRTESYDIDARRHGARLWVEVKGTTSAGEEVVLTKNEVEVYGKNHPATMLIVVSGIHLDRSTRPPTATGGKLGRVHPWSIASEDLTALSYRYVVPATD